MDKAEFEADAEMQEQVDHLAALPFVCSHVALMPDGHAGYGMPIGGILATDGVIVPYAVGVDIGCGVSLCTFPVKASELDSNLQFLVDTIRKQIPMGFAHRTGMPLNDYKDLEDQLAGSVIRDQLDRDEWNIAEQLGTLGGGNHFIELQANLQGNLCCLIHSGSRNIGLKVANYYNNIAEELNTTWYSSVPVEWNLSFLPEDSEEGQNYLADMRYCMEFAKLNRRCMMNVVTDIIGNCVDSKCVENATYLDVQHNYVKKEMHFNRVVWVHRKGAIRVGENELGIVPGSQGTESYIVRGLGNPESFYSCSHGAGRKMSRSAARKTLDMATEVSALEEKGIIHSIKHIADVDEAPGAYKNIVQVMENQRDLVTVEDCLRPLACIKAYSTP